MAFEPIKISGRELIVHPAVSDPEFASLPVLSGDPWEYVKLWLRKEHHEEAVFYWEQAHQFYLASTYLPETASPLTSYYCILNATKALLESKGQSYTSDRHGVDGETISGKRSLKNEIVEFKQNGVCAGLCKFLGETVYPNEKYNLYDVLFHVPFIHRTFQLTYKSTSELFIPLLNPKYVRKTNSTEAWFVAQLNPRYVNNATIRILPAGYERDKACKNCFLLRKKKRFDWDESNISNSILELVNYNKKIRNHVIPIFESTNRWYLKKKVSQNNAMKKSLLPILFATMHRLSELARYDPLGLSRHYDLQHNWLLTEFLRVAPAQYIYNIACEVTGKEFIRPYAFRIK